MCRFFDDLDFKELVSLKKYSDEEQMIISMGMIPIEVAQYFETQLDKVLIEKVGVGINDTTTVHGFNITIKPEVKKEFNRKVAVALLEKFCKL